MTALLTGLASLLVFGGVVLVHELGHFMAARHCGIHVEEFSIGFGPRLWAVQKSGTTYSLRLFPLGGYNLFSQPPEEDADPPAEESAPPRKAALFPLTVSGQQFEQATAWQRFFVTLCGALMNFLLGMAVLLVLALLAAALPVQGEQPPLGRRAAWGTAGIILCVVAASLVVALNWTPINYQTLFGLQGRYWLPVLPLALVLCKRAGNVSLRRNASRGAALAVTACTLLTLLQGFGLYASWQPVS